VEYILQFPSFQVEGGEDGVRPKAEGDGFADVRRAEKAGHAQAVHVGPSGNGLFEVQVHLIVN